MLFKKKKEEKKCCCSETESKVSSSLNDKNGIIVLGSRCKKCNELEENVKKAMISLEIEGEINHINEVQGEKMKAIVDNQNYILAELSKINDRIIGLYKTEK